MPPRSLTVLIVLGWLGVSGWLFVRDLRPTLFPAGPPPFSVDLVDEARTQASTRWTVFQHDDDLKGDVQKGYVETAIRYDPSNDTFELRSEFKLWQTGRVGHGSADRTIRSMYRVTREGALRELRSTFLWKIDPRAEPPDLIELDLEGAVRDGLLHPRLSVTVPERITREIPEALRPLLKGLESKELAPTSVSEGGSVLQPLQPVNRLPGLRKGQTWSVPLVTTGRVLNNLPGLGSSQFQTLEAKVLPELAEIDWNDMRVPCLVVQYEAQFEGEEIRLTQWVRESDGLVLKQAATLPGFEGGTLIMVRD